jgi:DNA-binding NtrC family response regulator
MKARILVIDDEPNIRTSFGSLLTDEGHRVETVATAEEAARLCSQREYDLLLLDLQLPGQSGIEFLRQQKSAAVAPKVLVISGQADIPTALEAVRLGAVDFLEKPVQPEKLIASVTAALALVSAERERTRLVNQLDEECRIVGDSPAIRKLHAAIGQVAPTSTTVLITGENGTGKELVATRLFLQSNRRDRPFLRINCPGIPETLFESELFGHMKGSFTGAVKDNPGKFVQADGGTIFLDEIGDLPFASQAKLLRVLETGEVETLGRPESQKVDVRILCATNRDLHHLVREGKFREDLFYRISVFAILVPPLSARQDDIPLLVGTFLKRYDPTGRTRLSAAALAHLGTLDYPGNVRQLKNVIERLTILYPDRTVEAEDVAEPFGVPPRQAGVQETARPLADEVALFEKRLIEATLQSCKGNISQAARRLQVDRANLSRKIKDLGLKSVDL